MKGVILPIGRDLQVQNPVLVTVSHAFYLLVLRASS